MTVSECHLSSYYGFAPFETRQRSCRYSETNVRDEVCVLRLRILPRIQGFSQRGVRPGFYLGCWGGGANDNFTPAGSVVFAGNSIILKIFSKSPLGCGGEWAHHNCTFHLQMVFCCVAERTEFETTWFALNKTCPLASRVENVERRSIPRTGNFVFVQFGISCAQMLRDGTDCWIFQASNPMWLLLYSNDYPSIYPPTSCLSHCAAGRFIAAIHRHPSQPQFLLQCV